jgi:hypothetical protein
MAVTMPIANPASNPTVSARARWFPIKALMYPAMA